MELQMQKLRSLFLWFIFFVVIGFTAKEILADIQMGQPILQINAKKLAFAFLLIIPHMCATLGWKKGFLFLLISGTIGFIFEWFGTSYGLGFGQPYRYTNAGYFGTTFAGVPLIIPLFWAFFIYVGYSITNAFLIGLGQAKPHLADWKKFLIILGLDGLWVVLVDLFLDPLMSHLGYWTWRWPGSWFGVPLRNFFGWFLVSILAMGIYRALEDRWPGKTHQPDSSYFIPVIGYGVLCMIFIPTAVLLNMPNLSIFGMIFMLPVVMANTLLFVNWIIQQKNQPKQSEKS